MLNIDAELLPLECGPRRAFDIYIHRLSFFFSVLGASTFLFVFLMNYLKFTEVITLPFDYSPPFLLFALAALTLVLSYFSWMFRGREKAIRELAILENMIEEYDHRSRVLRDWLESFPKSVLTLEEVDKLEILVEQAKNESIELVDLMKALKYRADRASDLAKGLKQHIDELNKPVLAVQATLSEINQSVPTLRRKFYSS